MRWSGRVFPDSVALGPAAHRTGRSRDGALGKLRRCAPLWAAQAADERLGQACKRGQERRGARRAAQRKGLLGEGQGGAAREFRKEGRGDGELEKAKLLEKQLETATHTRRLETQVDVLAQSALQREVASALSASVATSKKKSKGLLSRTETAVDEAAELKDLAEDISNAMGGLQNDVFDEDELEAELAELSAPAVRTKAVTFAEVTPKDAGEVVVEMGAFPSAPTTLPTSEETGVAAHSS